MVPNRATHHIFKLNKKASQVSDIPVKVLKGNVGKFSHSQFRALKLVLMLGPSFNVLKSLQGKSYNTE